MTQQLPQAFVEQMQNILGGEEMDMFLEAMSLPTSTAVRLHPQKGLDLFSEATQIGWSAHGKKLAERPSFTLDPLFHAGAYYVQDASSQFLEVVVKQFLDLQKSQTVLDLCAAPGGKSTHIASLLSSDSLLIANEVVHSRANILRENLWKWGLSNVLITSADPSYLAKSHLQCDAMVVDAPCSGEGLFRKDPDAISEWSSAHVAHCASRQKRILGDSWSMLAPGGVLIYSTCTWNRSENEDVLSWLVETFGAEMLPIQYDASWPLHATPHHTGNVLRFLPHHGVGEGYCIAALRKPSASSETHSSKKKIVHPKPFAAAKPLLDLSLESPEKYSPYLLGTEAYAAPLHLLPVIALLQEAKVPLLSAGTPLAEVFGAKKDVKPHPMLSHAVHFQKTSAQCVSLSHDEALAYLARRDITMSTSFTGRVCVIYNDLPLGWGKAQNGRILSLYPMYYRIRKAF